MKRREFLMSCLRVCGILMLVVGIMVIYLKPAPAQVKPSPGSKKITLKMVYQLPRTDRQYYLFNLWQDKVNAAAPEKLHIEHLGSNEVIPTFEQMEALKRGTVDLVLLAPTFYTGLLPEAMAIQCMGSGATIPEVRKKGMIALQDQIHRAKLGVTILGSLWAGDNHVILLKKPVAKADLSGLKIRGIPVHLPALRVLGGAITTIPPAEVFSALQTGLLDGAATPCVMVPDYKYAEVTNYVFFPLIPMDSFALVSANVKVWDGLPEDVRKIMMDNMLELEPKANSFIGDMEKGILNDLFKKGLKKVGATSPAEAEEITKKMRRAQWKTFIEDRADPVWLPKLNAMVKPVLGID